MQTHIVKDSAYGGWGTGTRFEPLTVPQWQQCVVLHLVELKSVPFPEDETQSTSVCLHVFP